MEGAVEDDGSCEEKKKSMKDKAKEALEEMLSGGGVAGIVFAVCVCAL